MDPQVQGKSAAVTFGKFVSSSKGTQDQGVPLFLRQVEG